MCKPTIPARFVALLLVLVFALTAVAKDKPFEMPKTFHAKTYPAVDAHDDEKVAIAADPYDLPDKAAIFTGNYAAENVLPIFFVVSNDSEKPVSLVDLDVMLITVDRAKLRPMSDDDLYRRFSHMKRRGDEPNTRPWPLPKPKLKASVKKNIQDEYESAQFLARAVETHTTRGGFLFFDVDELDHPLAGARLDISGVKDSSGSELLYFDISMKKYLTYQPGVTETPATK